MFYRAKKLETQFMEQVSLTRDSKGIQNIVIRRMRNLTLLQNQIWINKKFPTLNSSIISMLGFLLCLGELTNFHHKWPKALYKISTLKEGNKATYFHPISEWVIISNITLMNTLKRIFKTLTLVEM